MNKSFRGEPYLANLLDVLERHIDQALLEDIFGLIAGFVKHKAEGVRLVGEEGKMLTPSRS